MPYLRVTIVVGDGYIPDLMRRMEEYGITPGELAREMEKSEQEVSRWLRGRLKAPRMTNIEKIEMALVNLRRRKGKRVTPSKDIKAAR